MKATLFIRYPNYDAEYSIEVSDWEWQRYQEGNLEPSNISPVSLEDSEEWELEAAE